MKPKIRYGIIFKCKIDQQPQIVGYWIDVDEEVIEHDINFFCLEYYRNLKENETNN